MLYIKYNIIYYIYLHKIMYNPVSFLNPLFRIIRGEIWNEIKRHAFERGKLARLAITIS